MQGHVLQMGSNKSTWLLKYVSVGNQMITISQDENDHASRCYDDVVCLENIAVYLDESIDKFKRKIYLIQLVTPFPKRSLVFGWWYPDTRNTWFTAVLTEYTKILIREPHNEEMDVDVSVQCVAKTSMAPRKDIGRMSPFGVFRRNARKRPIIAHKHNT